MTKKGERRAALIRSFLDSLPDVYQIVDCSSRFSEDWCPMADDKLDLLIDAWSEQRPANSTPPEILAALRSYKELHGRRWKSILLHLWESGQDEGVLRRARNIVGPSGLDKLAL
jgi:hypothetical protein